MRPGKFCFPELLLTTVENNSFVLVGCLKMETLSCFISVAFSRHSKFIFC